jgi:protein-glutamine gamma-glutamyltransferase
MTRRPRAQRSSSCIPPRLAWCLWVLVAATVAPVCQAQGLSLLTVLAPAGAGLGIAWTLRRDRGVLHQAVVAGIAIVLAGLTALVSIDAGLIGVFPVADWLIAVAVLKCWQLNTSRDAAHVLIVAALLLFIGALVSGHLNYAISLIVALAVGPLALVNWHMLAETERYARLTGAEPAAAAALLNRAGPFRRISAIAAFFCAAVGFIVFATFPRMRTPLQPNVQTAAQAITGFSTEARLNEIGRLQQSDRVYMRVRLTMDDQSIGAEGNLPYFRAMTYNYYTGKGWEDRGRGTIDCKLPDDASLKYFRQLRNNQPQAAVEQEYHIEAGPPPRLFSLAQSVPVAVGSQEISDVRWKPSDDTFLPLARLPSVVKYRISSVPSYVLGETPEDTRPTSTRPDGSAIRRPRTAPAPVVQSEVRALAFALAAEVTGDPDDPAKDPATHEQIVSRFLRHLGGPDFQYTLEGQPRGSGFGNLEKFLFQTKRGYCEYFASALTVLCQSVGIPARYVTGFHGGQYNDVGGFYSVRDSDAHSWVEVWLPDSGWRLFDPTPPDTTHATQSSLRARLMAMLDYLQFQWSNWVVAYDILHRQTLFGTFGDWFQTLAFGKSQSWVDYLWTFEQLLLGPDTLSPLGKILYWLGLLGVLALSCYLLVQLARHLVASLRRRRLARGARATGVRFYQQVVTALAARGFVRCPTETPREFALRVEDAFPASRNRLTALIDHYYAARFGRQSPAGAKALSRELLLILTASRTPRSAPRRA